MSLITWRALKHYFKVEKRAKCSNPFGARCRWLNGMCRRIEKVFEVRTTTTRKSNIWIASGYLSISHQTLYGRKEKFELLWKQWIFPRNRHKHLICHTISIRSLQIVNKYFVAQNELIIVWKRHEIELSLLSHSHNSHNRSLNRDQSSDEYEWCGGSFSAFCANRYSFQLRNWLKWILGGWCFKGTRCAQVESLNFPQWMYTIPFCIHRQAIESISHRIIASCLPYPNVCLVLSVFPVRSDALQAEQVKCVQLFKFKGGENLCLAQDNHCVSVDFEHSMYCVLY